MGLVHECLEVLESLAQREDPWARTHEECLELELHLESLRLASLAAKSFDAQSLELHRLPRCELVCHDLQKGRRTFE